MRDGIRIKRRPLDIIIVTVLVLYAIIVLFPMLWVVLTSFKTNADFVGSPWGLPHKLDFTNFINAWVNVNFKQYAFNSIFITCVSVFLVVVLAAPASYILTRVKMRGSKILLFLFISGLYVPVALVLPTEFLLFNSLNLYNNQFALILLYVVFSLPYSILVLSGFYESVPKEIEEAARVDGCSYNKCFWRIVFPMSMNGISTIIIMNLIWIWNDYIFALTFLQDSAKMTLPVGIIGLMQSFKLKADWVTLFAGLCFVMIPSIIAFLVFQKSMIRGLTAGALKE
jgi:ABC-type glycerol-3-phosphate transport system permease component